MQTTDTLARADAAQSDPYRSEVQVLDPDADESHIVRGLD